MPRTDTASCVIAAPPARVFAALVDRDALQAWLPPDGMAATFERFDARPGGSYRLVLTYLDPSSAPGKTTADADVVEVRYVDIVPGVRVVQAVDFESDDPAFAGTMTMTWEVVAVDDGTRVDITATDVPDGIGADDHVQILLSTFNDGRQATVLAVNPLGVQSDGALVETGSTSGNGFNNAVVRRENADLSPDYIYHSKGRLTDYGYEVEIRIPFKSLRYPGGERQIWGFNVTRIVQRTGYTDTWTDVRRANASFIGQEGALGGLHDGRGAAVDILGPHLEATHGYQALWPVLALPILLAIPLVASLARS